MAENAKVARPEIVGHAERPEAALGAFIAQELENWGFDVGMSNFEGTRLRVDFEDQPNGSLYVSVERVRDVVVGR